MPLWLILLAIILFSLLYLDGFFFPSSSSKNTWVSFTTSMQGYFWRNSSSPSPVENKEYVLVMCTIRNFSFILCACLYYLAPFLHSLLIHRFPVVLGWFLIVDSVEVPQLYPVNFESIFFILLSPSHSADS